MRASLENGAWNLKTISLFLLTYHSYVMPVKHALLNPEAREAKKPIQVLLLCVKCT